MLPALTKAKPSIKPGDRYHRPGNPPSIWVVERLIERQDHPLHVVLFQEGRRRTITIAVSVLGDVQQFRKVNG